MQKKSKNLQIEDIEEWVISYIKITGRPLRALRTLKIICRVYSSVHKNSLNSFNVTELKLGLVTFVYSLCKTIR